MDDAEVVDLAVFVFCIAAFVTYHLWYFLRGRWGKPNKWQVGRRRRRHYVDMWSTSVKTRGLWAVAMMADPREGMLTVQTWRNVIIAATLLVTAQMQIASRLLQVLTTTSQLEKVASYSGADPLTGSNPLADPELKIALALGALFLSLLTFAQCARLAVHLGFLTRVVPEHPRTSLPIRDEVIAMTRRASLYFTVGLRFFYLFIPLIMWLLGTLALLITTLVLLAALVSTDQVRVDDSFSRYARKLYDEDKQEEAAASIAEGEEEGEGEEGVYQEEEEEAHGVDAAERGGGRQGHPATRDGASNGGCAPVHRAHEAPTSPSRGSGRRGGGGGAEHGRRDSGRWERSTSGPPHTLPRVTPPCLRATDTRHCIADVPR